MPASEKLESVYEQFVKTQTEITGHSVTYGSLIVRDRIRSEKPMAEDLEDRMIKAMKFWEAKLQAIGKNGSWRKWVDAFYTVARLLSVTDVSIKQLCNERYIATVTSRLS